MNSKFVDYCDQAESIRDTCFRDPAQYELYEFPLTGDQVQDQVLSHTEKAEKARRKLFWLKVDYFIVFLVKKNDQSTRS